MAMTDTKVFFPTSFSNSKKMERAPIAARTAGKLWHIKVRIDCDSDSKIIYRFKKYPRQHQASDTT